MTLQTIADRVGVSRMTVSNAFSNPDQLSSALRAKILATADELGYAGPDPTGRALATGTSSAIGILLTDTLYEAFTDEVATAFLAAIAEAIESRGLAMTLLTAGHETAVPARDVALDGAMIYSCRPTSPGRDWLLRRKLPLVFVDQEPIDGVAAVNVDDYGGAVAAGRHVAELGHERVALVTHVVPVGSGAPAGPTDYGEVQRQRLDGWREGLGDVAPMVVIDLPHASDDDELRAVLRDLLTAPDRPTAVICFSDVLALHVVGVAHEVGLAVPADLSVVGFDDSRAARLATPALTTVRQDVVAKGRHAAALLLATIDARRDGTPPPTDRITLPTELVVRASTAVAR